LVWHVGRHQLQSSSRSSSTSSSRLLSLCHSCLPRRCPSACWWSTRLSTSCQTVSGGLAGSTSGTNAQQQHAATTCCGKVNAGCAHALVAQLSGRKVQGGVLGLRAAHCSTGLACVVLHRLCRLRNGAEAGSNPAPVYLDQVVVQYWFQGPQQAAAAVETASNSSTTSSIAAQADASQLSWGCNDAGAPLRE
jgi:hypothetical protein